MRYKPTAYLILKTLKDAQCGLSAKAIAEKGNIDTTSENLQRIEQECWDFVQAGRAYATDLREQTNGALFFQLL